MGLILNNTSNENQLFFSSYNIYFCVDSKYYVFNTWHGNLIRIDENNYKAFETSNIDFISSDLIKEFTSLGFLSPYKNDYINVVKENLIHQNEYQKKYFSICISPTLMCNASCYYCFEKGIDGEVNFDERTEQSVVNYIVEKGKNKKIHITWFGGEPLIGAKSITTICNGLKEKGVNFKSSIITNGFFINNFLDSMKDLWNIKQVQITIDNLFEKYNAVKKMGKNGFDKVISNIHLLINKNIKVALRVNYDAENLDNYQEIIDYIYNEFKNDVKLYFHDIIGEDFKTPDEASGMPLIKIYKSLSQKGYVKSLRDLKIQRKFSACSINKEDFINVYPGGWTCKCEHFVGKKSIFDSGNINYEKIKDNLSFSSINNKCSKCKCFPICSGGCYANHLMRESAGCFRGNSYIEEILGFYVKFILDKNFEN